MKKGPTRKDLQFGKKNWSHVDSFADFLKYMNQNFRKKIQSAFPRQHAPSEPPLNLIVPIGSRQILVKSKHVCGSGGKVACMESGVGREG